MSENIDGFLSQLQKLICQAFSIKELRYEICLELDSKLENISGETDLPSIVLDLIGYFHRRKDLERLIEKCREKRPKYDWPQPPIPANENIEQIPPTYNYNLQEGNLGIIGTLYRQLCIVLSECGPFDTDQELIAIFVDKRLSSWRNHLPQADTRVGRVERVIDFLHNQYNDVEENGLVLLLRVLSERLDSGNACYHNLAKLADELERELNNFYSDHSERPERPIQILSQDVDVPESLSNRKKINALTKKAILVEKDGDHEATATLCTKLAGLLKQEKYYVRAIEFARKSARHFLETNKKENAIKQYLFAAKVWINHTAFAVTMASSDLEKAEKIASEISNSALLAQVFLLQAQYGILRGFRQDTEKMWQKVASLLPKVHPDFQIKISTELAIQKAMVARLDGKIEMTKTILEEADSRDWPARFVHIRLELLWCLLFLYSELAYWEDVDRVYENAQKLLGKEDESQNARWLMHYASSLARRGKADDAFITYLAALDFFKSERANSSQKYHFFQDMVYSLIRHTGHEGYSFAMKYDTERLDLTLNVLHEDVGHLHRARARKNYFLENTDLTISHARYSLIHAWRKGDWSALSEANKILAFLYHAERKYTPATFAALAAGENTLIEKYAPSLNNLRTPDEIKRVIDNLIQEWPTPADLQQALLALSKCTDIVPPSQIEQVIQYVVSILEQYLSTQLASNTCRNAVQVLRSLALQFDQSQTQQIVQFSISVLNNQQVHWIVRREFILLLADCFDNNLKIQSKLQRSAMEVVLGYYGGEDLKSEAKIALLKIANTVPIKIRDEITTFFRKDLNWDYLAILNEPIPEETVKRYIENILRSITPRQEKGSRSFGFGGANARSIINFNDYIMPSFGNFIIKELLGIIRNPEVPWIHKSDAILALRWLPENLLREQANEISQLLVEVADGNHTDSETDVFLKWFSDEEEIRRNSIYALAHISSIVNDRLKKKVFNRIRSFSNNNASTIRMGAAMALRVLEGSYRFPTELTFILVELLQDEDPRVRHWAASAAGHRIADGKIPKKTSDFIIQRLLEAAEKESDPHARAGVAYGLRISLGSNRFNESFQDRVQETMNKLVNDVSYQVRRLATGQKKPIN